MQIRYYPETDSLYIAFQEKPSNDAIEAAPNVILDLDSGNNVIGIDIAQYASKIVDLKKIEFHFDCAEHSR